ncbi:cysteine hydrolase [Comamonas sp. NoAH]|uniref:cysteine hydrolase n=1 Tax=Comamonas halotolerans TaxID=3041496 RepID=UPI0024E158D5|nr:cysteine hydrolase [Comamonas sp. NoAH]
MTLDTQLLLIDPQNDFCDLPANLCPQDLSPTLPVPGAHADMQRVAQWLRLHGRHIDHITVTLDSHQIFDIAHPVFWQCSDGSEVPPFTSIHAAQVRQGLFTPRQPAHLERALVYLDALETRGRYTLMVWPVHCEIGSWGHGVHADVLAACASWQHIRQRAVLNVFKGTNPWTEHYSALEAEVPDTAAPETCLNQPLLATLLQARHLIVAGEASSHCVRATVEHLLEQAPNGFASRITLLTDGMSPVQGFDTQQQVFLQQLQDAGARLCSTSEFKL